MKLLRILENLSFVLSLIFFFIDWKIGLSFFIIMVILRVIPHEPDYLLYIISGLLLIAGIVTLFLTWKLGIILVVSGYLVTKFRVHVNTFNLERFGTKYPSVWDVENYKHREVNKRSLVLERERLQREMAPKFRRCEELKAISRDKCLPPENKAALYRHLVKNGTIPIEDQIPEDQIDLYFGVHQD